MKKIIIFILLLTFGFSISQYHFKVKADTPIVYYVSDNPSCSTFKSQLMTTTGLSNNEIVLYDWSIVDSIVFDFFDDVDTIEDAIIIFEITKDFIDPIYNFYYSTPLVDTLYDIFYTLKENGCSIIFISAADEVRYESRNDFLDYVDFHIMTNLRVNFFMNVLYRSELLNNTSPLEDIGLIFSNDFMQFYGGYSRFITIYLVPYICSRYDDDIINGYTQAESLNNNNVYLYCETHLNQYTLISTGAQLSLSDITNLSYYYYTPVYYVGASNTTTSGTWLTQIALQQPEVLFYYNFYSFDYSNIINTNITSVYEYDPANNSTPSILTMVTDFITEINDYTLYDNWEGRCYVTHIFQNFNYNGWMVNFYGYDGDFINCWDIYSESYTNYIHDGSLFI